MSEASIQLKIIKFLQTNNIYCWRNANLTRYDPKTKQYLSNPQHKSGLGDIVGLLPDGRHLEIEVKKKGGRQSPHQLIHQKRIEQNNGIYILAYDVKTVDNSLADYLKKP